MASGGPPPFAASARCGAPGSDAAMPGAVSIVLSVMGGVSSGQGGSVALGHHFGGRGEALEVVFVPAAADLVGGEEAERDQVEDAVNRHIGQHQVVQDDLRHMSG